MKPWRRINNSPYHHEASGAPRFSRGWAKAVCRLFSGSVLWINHSPSLLRFERGLLLCEPTTSSGGGGNTRKVGAPTWTTTHNFTHRFSPTWLDTESHCMRPFLKQNLTMWRLQQMLLPKFVFDQGNLFGSSSEVLFHQLPDNINHPLLLELPRFVTMVNGPSKLAHKPGAKKGARRPAPSKDPPGGTPHNIVEGYILLQATTNTTHPPSVQAVHSANSIVAWLFIEPR